MSDHEAILKTLAAPFDPSEVKFKPGAVTRDGKKAMALAYVDARAIQDRLDDVFGLNWRDEYEFRPDGVLCKLSVRIEEEWITRVDVGSFSEQQDEGDRLKAAVSDALKRAAVKFGVGRYLYRLPTRWRAWNAQYKRFEKEADEETEAPQEKPPAPPANGETQAARRARAWKLLEIAARDGLESFRLTWPTLPLEDRKAITEGDQARLKQICQEADHARETRSVPDA